MPVIAGVKLGTWAVAAASGAVGFWLGGGVSGAGKVTEGLSDVAKLALVGGALYVGARYFKVL
jgi:hypothetical protein